MNTDKTKRWMKRPSPMQIGQCEWGVRDEGVWVGPDLLASRGGQANYGAVSRDARI